MINRRRPILASFATVVWIVLLAISPVRAETRFITVASTTSTEQSGLFGHLLPAFTKATGIDVRVIAVGTGQALKLGQNGDADVVFVHDRPSELRFVAEGWGVERREVMYNDFVVVGPKIDPAGITGSHDAVASFRKIAESKASFVSRGDDSGTNKEELRLWHDAGLDPNTFGSGWYKDIGGGMGSALNAAAAMGAYTLSDRGTWLSFRNRQDLVIAVQGDKRLFNQYGVMLVNPARHPNVKQDLGKAFINWLVSPSGQQTIARYKINGEQLFYPDATKEAS